MSPVLECDTAITEAAIRSSLGGFAAVEAFAAKLVADGQTEGGLILDFGARLAVMVTVRNGVAYASMAAM